ncbi:galectin-9-like [Styela clava]
MSAPMFNPIVPLNVNVSLRPGFMVYINGTPNGGRFSVNFKGPRPDDHALHFNPRFDSGNIVVRNTKRNGMWEAEERASNGFPFMMGQPFELIILCQQHQYKIAVNGRHFIEYGHRINMQNVRFLSIEGAVQISMVRFDHEVQPQPQPMGVPSLINNPAVPCTAVVPFKNIRGRRVTVSGIPQNRNPHRIMFDFVSDSGDIFLHFNPRIPERAMVRNTEKNKCWGQEERALSVPFPFQYGVPFQLMFRVDQAAFHVELNGMEICTYAHRIRPLNLIRTLRINGAVNLTKVQFE